MIAEPRFAASCVCNRVVLQALGAPIVSSVCYCDDCQEGARRIESLPKAVAVLDPDGGTAYLLFRKDRIFCSDGAERLKNHKLKQASDTNRVVATCCNSAMFMKFDAGPYWIAAYRARFRGELPPLEMRICTKFRRSAVELPNDAPNYSRYPLRLMARLLAGGVMMLLNRQRPRNRILDQDQSEK